MSARLTLLPAIVLPIPRGRRPDMLTEIDRGLLMVAAQGGNGGAYRRLLTDLTGWLERYFGRRLPPAVVDDAVQETLLAVHRRRHTYDPAYPLTPWLGAIARRKWVDQLRSLKRRSADQLTDCVATPDHEIAITSASILASLLTQLRPAQSSVIRLVKLQGYSIDEASCETGQSVAAVKVNIHRGLARLTDLIMKTNDVE